MGGKLACSRFDEGIRRASSSPAQAREPSSRTHEGVSEGKKKVLDYAPSATLVVS